MGLQNCLNLTFKANFQLQKSKRRGLQFFNRRYSFLSFSGPQLSNLEALPFTYRQYVVIELGDKLCNSIIIFFSALQKYVFHIGLKREPNVDKAQ